MVPLTVLLLAAGGTAAWFHFVHVDGDAPKAAKRSSEFLPLETLTVNLASASIDRYLQVGITLEVENSGVADELKRRMPVIRSRVLLLLSAKTAEELATTAGKAKLMDELLAEARAPLPAGEAPGRGVEKVHFSAFVIQ